MLFGFIIYKTMIRPIAVASCLIDSSKCITLEYQTVGNTALIHDESTDRYIWFVGDDILLYNEPTGRICENPYQSAFVWNLSENKAKGYSCSSPVDEVKERYYSSVPVRRLVVKTRGTLDMYGMINVLIDNEIISLPSKKSVT